ncbi:MAG TPA: SMC-Scp complex subunit ScpB [Candidatus Acidoferrales bacterium]|nr:SMC-Scp complex subunit ScpB [Candidatus Acidoferrales bacterium]
MSYKKKGERMTEQELQSALEAIIYAADEPATLDQIMAAVGGERAEVRAGLDRLVASYAVEERGVEIRKVAGGWKMYTKAQHHEVVRRFIKSLRPPLRLTIPALETLSVIAYKQPATLPEINEVRGVNCGGVVKTLLERRLITTAGRKEAVGRPILYRTSKDFLMRFGLADLDELPSLKEFEQLAQAALGADEGIAPTEPEEEVSVAPAIGRPELVTREPQAREAEESEAQASDAQTDEGDVRASGENDLSAAPQDQDQKDDDTQGKAAGI